MSSPTELAAASTAVGRGDEAGADERLTIVDEFRRAAAGGRGGITFHAEQGVVALTAAEVWRRALLRAGQLVERDAGSGARVGLMGGNASEWVEWAWGTWLAGAALVPLPAPIRLRDRDAFAAEARALIVATGCTHVVGEGRYLAALEQPPCPLLDWSADPGRVERRAPESPALSDLGLVLCTSGSTSEPKGIRITHAVLRARSIAWASLSADLCASGPPVYVSWLPFYHAAGLGVVTSLAGPPAEHHVLPVERLGKDPAEWLRLVSRLRATVTFGPSSAWSSAVRALERHPEPLDLSSLRYAAFSLELADPTVVDRVLQLCMPLGLRREALMNGYGLSEGIGTVTAPGTGLRIDAVDVDELLGSGRALPPSRGSAVKRIVSCGSPSPHVDVAIGSPSAPLPERRVGEVYLRSATNSDGYVDAPDDPMLVDGWLRTGDLGYLADGELFLTGRAKEIIIHLGRNFHPQDIEWAVLRATGAAADSCVAFVPVRGAEGDVVVVLEDTSHRSREALSRAVRAAIVNAFGLVPREVLVVSPGSIPHAANGKLQRLRAREMHAQGEFIP